MATALLLAARVRSPPARRMETKDLNGAYLRHDDDPKVRFGPTSAFKYAHTIYTCAYRARRADSGAAPFKRRESARVA